MRAARWARPPARRPAATPGPGSRGWSGGSAASPPRRRRGRPARRPRPTDHVPGVGEEWAGSRLPPGGIDPALDVVVDRLDNGLLLADGRLVADLPEAPQELDVGVAPAGGDGHRPPE